MLRIYKIKNLKQELTSKMNELSEESDGRDALDSIFEKMYPKSSIKNITPDKCERADFEKNESILNEVIKTKIENKGLPITLRKRLLYERAIAS